MKKKSAEQKQEEAQMAAAQDAPEQEQSSEQAPPVGEPIPEAEQLKAQIAALEASLKHAKDEAFDEMARALGQDPAKLRAAAAGKAKHEGEEYEIDLGVHEVYINGHPYSGVVRGSYALCEQLASLAGNKRNRILNEKIGNQGVVDMLNSGIRTRIVGKLEE